MKGSDPTLLVTFLTTSLVPEGTTRYGNGVAGRIFGIGEHVSPALVHSTDLEPLFQGPGAECFDISHVEYQLDGGLAILSPAAQGVKHDVAPRPARAFQLDDAIIFFPANPVAEMKHIERGDGLDVVDVEQDSAKNGRRTVGLVLPGHSFGFNAGQFHSRERLYLNRAGR